jgi:hypothetical protein
MPYIPPFETLRGKLQSVPGATGRVTLSYEDLLGVLKRVMAGVVLDEAWYLRENPDVERGIKSGILQSARQHFLDHGYFEGRMPFRITVDSVWYLTRYPDVADDLQNGRITSAQAHFDESGYREGRLPFELDL